MFFTLKGRAASIETLFSRMSYTKTTAKNRMTTTNMKMITIIKSHLSKQAQGTTNQRKRKRVSTIGVDLQESTNASAAGGGNAISFGNDTETNEVAVDANAFEMDDVGVDEDFEAFLDNMMNNDINNNNDQFGNDASNGQTPTTAGEPTEFDDAFGTRQPSASHYIDSLFDMGQFQAALHPSSDDANANASGANSSATGTNVSNIEYTWTLADIL